MARGASRLVLVGLFGILSLIGVPALVSLAKPGRERDDVALVLLAGEDVARLPG